MHKKDAKSRWATTNFADPRAAPGRITEPGLFAPHWQNANNNLKDLYTYFLLFSPFSHSQIIMPRRLVPSPFTLNRFTVVQVRYNSTVGTGARGSVIDTQHVPAPGAGHIKVLLLNRPEARNAISRELLDSLTKHVNSIDAENGKGPTRALVLASNIDAAFCAGADLKERAKFTREEYVFIYFIF